MNPFTYDRSGEVRAAVNALAADPRAQFLAGGTTLVDLMKLDVETPERVIDINHLPLAEVEEAAGGRLRIGAMVRNSDLAYDERVRRRYPMLSEALLSGASAQLRNMATTGGNLMQRTRCHYFRDTSYPCNMREPGSGCSAVGGYNRMHAILGISDKCIATHPSDMAVAMMALDARIHVQGPRDSRVIPIEQFYVPYGKDPSRLTTLEHGELITYVDLLAAPIARRSHYLKVRDRASYEFALASAAVAMTVRDGTVHDVRIALGGVATLPWRARAAERSLTGQRAGKKAYRAAAETELASARASRYNAFKVELARRTIVQALSTVGEMS